MNKEISSGGTFLNLEESEMNGRIPKTTQDSNTNMRIESRIRILKCHWRTNVQIKSPVTLAFVTGLWDCTFVHLYIFL